MAKHNRSRPVCNAQQFPYVEDISRYDVHEDGDWSIPESLQCKWDKCSNERYAGTPLCFLCALRLAKFMEEILKAMRERGAVAPCELRLTPDVEPEIKAESWVYYLMLSPTSVKIGTTRSLKTRLSALYSEPQYVVALERGDHALEHQRHRQFATDRIEREKFGLSKRLKTHIESLQPERDELMALALAPRVQAQ